MEILNLPSNKLRVDNRFLSVDNNVIKELQKSIKEIGVIYNTPEKTNNFL